MNDKTVKHKQVMIEKNYWYINEMEYEKHELSLVEKNEACEEKIINFMFNANVNVNNNHK